MSFSVDFRSYFLDHYISKKHSLQYSFLNRIIKQGGLFISQCTWERPRKEPELRAPIVVVNGFPCPIVALQGDISVTPLVMIQKNVLAVSRHVFNQHTMLSGPAFVPATVPGPCSGA